MRIRVVFSLVVVSVLTATLTAAQATATDAGNAALGDCIEPEVSPTPFVDVPTGAFFAAPVAWAYHNSITTGSGPTTFSPDAPVTRAQFATFLHRALCEPEASVEAPFDDLEDGAYYRRAVNWLFEHGYTTGTSATTYDPDGLVTRGELATFLHRLVGEPSGAPVSPFVDVDRGRYFAAPIDWLRDAGITTGRTASRFDPGGLVTRGEAVTFLYRMNLAKNPIAVPTGFLAGATNPGDAKCKFVDLHTVAPPPNPGFVGETYGGEVISPDQAWETAFYLMLYANCERQARNLAPLRMYTNEQMLAMQQTVLGISSSHEGFGERGDIAGGATAEQHGGTLLVGIVSHSTTADDDDDDLWSPHEVARRSASGRQHTDTVGLVDHGGAMVSEKYHCIFGAVSTGVTDNGRMDVILFYGTRC
ncbi:MAG: S-layer homology domain-containing protein [Actinomycetota bacterium]